MLARCGASCLSTAHGRRLIVDEYAAFGAAISRRRIRLVFVGIDAVLFKNLCNQFSDPPSTSKTAEMTARSAAEADHVRRSFLAHEQAESINQDGFPRAGFAGQQIQPRSELDGEMVDDGVILKAQFEEHDGPRKQELSAE